VLQNQPLIKRQKNIGLISNRQFHRHVETEKRHFQFSHLSNVLKNQQTKCSKDLPLMEKDNSNNITETIFSGDNIISSTMAVSKLCIIL